VRIFVPALRVVFVFHFPIMNTCEAVVLQQHQDCISGPSAQLKARYGAPPPLPLDRGPGSMKGPFWFSLRGKSKKSIVRKNALLKSASDPRQRKLFT